MKLQANIKYKDEQRINNAIKYVKNFYMKGINSVTTSKRIRHFKGRLFILLLQYFLPSTLAT